MKRELAAQARLVLSPKRRLAVISDLRVWETPLSGGACNAIIYGKG